MSRPFASRRLASRRGSASDLLVFGKILLDARDDAGLVDPVLDAEL